MDPLLWFSIWLIVLAALAGLTNVLVGLASFTTGKDYWPKALRRLRRGVPASDEDRRTFGLYLMLNGSALMPIILLSGMTQLTIQTVIAPEPEKAVRFLLIVVGVATSLALITASFRLSRSIRYLDYPTSPATGPETPAK